MPLGLWGLVLHPQWHHGRSGGGSALHDPKGGQVLLFGLATRKRSLFVLVRSMDGLAINAEGCYLGFITNNYMKMPGTPKKAN